ncbi:hypothetical protein [Lentzea sp. NPDC060358]|uniref:hypothetical protein n=1 Tax=Lentzea sp. NPDC060358 TaxID=3347103 RepID=UPI0036467996
MSRVLTVNAGSGSLKAHLLDPDAEEVIATAEVGHPPDSDEARHALDELLDRVDEVTAVGHRLVHGGPDLRARPLWTTGPWPPHSVRRTWRRCTYRRP